MNTFYDAGAAGGLGILLQFLDLMCYIFFKFSKPQPDARNCVAAVKGMFVCFTFTIFDDEVEAILNTYI